jgi:hypothetical protein
MIDAVCKTSAGKKKYLGFAIMTKINDSMSVGAELAARITRMNEMLTLTDAEREAIAAGLGALEAIYDDEPQISRPLYDAYAPTLRGLLERTRCS